MNRARTYGILILAALLFSVYTFTNAGRLHIVDEASLFAVTESIGQRAEVNTNAIAWTQWVNSPGEVLGAFGPHGDVYSKKGPAPAVLAVPWYLLLRLLTFLNINLGLLQGTLLWNGMVVAFTAALLWLTAVRLGYRERTGLRLALLFGLATIAWPYATQFFGEPLSAFSLLLAFYGILSWKETGRARWMLYAGVGAGIALATVTAHALLVALLGLYTVAAWFLRRRTATDTLRGTLTAAAAFVAPILAAGALLLLYNWMRFGSAFDTGYHFTTGEGFTTPIWQGLWGLLFSPYRSVFLHTPLFIASMAAFVPFTRRHRVEGVLIALMSLVLVGMYSMWWMWWGGYAWGPRFLVPLAPFWVLLLAPLTEQFALLHHATATRSKRALDYGLLALVIISFLVQVAAVSINFVNYETLLRSEYFPTNWADPLAFGPPAQSLRDFFLSPVFGQFRLLARGGMATHSDLAWLWPGGKIAWNVLIVGLAAIITLSWLLLRWSRALRSDRPRDAIPSPPMLSLVLLIPMIFLGAWLGSLAHDPIYGTEGAGYRAAISDICLADRGDDAVLTIAPYSYHIPMNWLGSECRYGLPVYGYALNSMEHPQTEQVLATVAADAGRIIVVTEGIAPGNPENGIERWLADNAYKADDRWFDDNRVLRYATGAAIARVQNVSHNLFISDAAGNRVTIVASRVPPSAQAGAAIPIDLQYMLHVPAVDDLRWFVQLLAPSGEAVAQLDTGIVDNLESFTSLAPNELYNEKAGLQLPADLPPGDYQVIAGLYNPNAANGARLRAADGREYLVLSTLTVTN